MPSSAQRISCAKHGGDRRSSARRETARVSLRTSPELSHLRSTTKNNLGANASSLLTVQSPNYLGNQLRQNARGSVPSHFASLYGQLSARLP